MGAVLPARDSLLVLLRRRLKVLLELRIPGNMNCSLREGLAASAGRPRGGRR